MYSKTAADHFAEAITRLSSRPNPFNPPTAEEPTAPPAAPKGGRPLSIAFSREAGAGGVTVAHEVGKHLGWPVYDRELFEKLAQDMKVDVSLIEDYDERRGSWLVDTIKAFSATASVSETAYFHRLVRMLQALGERGECIVVGRGSPYILPRETTLRVRIVASRADRIAFIAASQNLSRADATAFVETQDRDRVKFIKDHFHKDPDDPLSYDLIINRSRFSVEETSELVVSALRRMRARTETAKTQG